MQPKADGYRGIWYMNQPTGDEYVYKYSGGLGTYCSSHQPFAIHCPAVNKTFFCYGGTQPGFAARPEVGLRGFDSKDIPDALLHMVSSFDHATGEVPRPTILLDKHTLDAHDNPVISADGDGRIWIFSTSHGTGRPSFIHRSVRPYDIGAFERVNPTRLENGVPVPFDNFSYMQVWWTPAHGFRAFFTRYNAPVIRTLGFATSQDGIAWSAWQPIGAIDEGHYQVSAVSGDVAGSAFNYHPNGKGLNFRTNLYYVQTRDGGRTWEAADGTPVTVPLRSVQNQALARDFEREGLKIYMQDIAFDADGRPVCLYVASRGYQPGPANGPFTWQTARWTGREWEFRDVTASDSNYDMGSLYIEADGRWRIIGPTEPGPQPFNPGGEIAMWISADRGSSWRRERQMTAGSARNHTYARRPVNAHPGFYALWADGDARRPSDSSLYFCDRAGTVYRLPEHMREDTARPGAVPSLPRPA